MRRSNKTRRISREIIAPLIRRPNAASAKQHMTVPFWAYSLHSLKKSKRTRRVKRQ